MDPKLQNLPELLKPYLGPGKTVKNTKLTRLTQPGENFGSVMLKLDVTVGNEKNNSEEMVHAVAKLLPDTEIFRKLFHVQTTFTNEMSFYDTVVPTLQTFQRELGIDKVIETFPKCIATRKNLTGGDVIDDDAVLILDNLIELGYRNIDRHEGFDLETIQLVLKDLAQFHAVPLALKLKHPETFEKKIKAHCHDFEPPKLEQFHEVLKDMVRENSELAHLAPKITYWGQCRRSAPREPFATVIHTDLWTNNTMQKFQDGRPMANKFVDFQMIDYGSPVSDVLFLLWSSVPKEVLEPHLEPLLKHYHQHFLEVLQQHQIDVSPFSYEKFLEELELESEYEFGHALHFCVFNVNRREDDLDFENFNGQAFLDNTSQTVKDKVWYMVRECARRRWLK